MKTSLYNALTPKHKELVDTHVYDACVKRYGAFNNTPQVFIDSERESFARKIPILEQLADSSHKANVAKPKADGHAQQVRDQKAYEDRELSPKSWY